MGYPDGDKMIIGCKDGYLYEYSTKKESILYAYPCFATPAIAGEDISSMATTIDNKTLFVCDIKGSFREIDISTQKQVNNFNVKNAVFCVVTYDNKFLITAEDERNCNLTKWSIQEKGKYHSWKSDIDQYVFS